MPAGDPLSQTASNPPKQVQTPGALHKLACRPVTSDDHGPIPEPRAGFVT